MSKAAADLRRLSGIDVVDPRSPFQICPSCSLEQVVAVTAHKFAPLRVSKSLVASLTVESHARSSDSVLYFSSDTVAGFVEVQTDKSWSVDAIRLEAACSLRNGVNGQISTLARQEIPLFTRKDGRSHYLTQVLVSKRNDSESVEYHGEMASPAPPGVYRLNFTFNLYDPSSSPTQRRQQADEETRNTHCPVSIYLPFANQTRIWHNLSVIISRGIFQAAARADYSFTYLPRSRPPVPSLLRSLAYAEGRDGPDATLDPEGWRTRTAGPGGCLELHLPEPKCYPRELPVRIHVLAPSVIAKHRTSLSQISVTFRQHVSIRSFSAEPTHFINVINRGKYIREGRIGDRLALEMEIDIGQAKPSFENPQISMEVCHNRLSVNCQYAIDVRLTDRHGDRVASIVEPLQVVTDQARLHPGVIELLGDDLGRLPPRHEHSAPPDYEVWD